MHWYKRSSSVAPVPAQSGRPGPDWLHNPSAGAPGVSSLGAGGWRGTGQPELSAAAGVSPSQVSQGCSPQPGDPPGGAGMASPQAAAAAGLGAAHPGVLRAVPVLRRKERHGSCETPGEQPLAGSRLCCQGAPGEGRAWDSEPGSPHPPSFSSSLSSSSSVPDPPLFSSFSSCGRSRRGFLGKQECRVSGAALGAGGRGGSCGSSYRGEQDPGCGSACACAYSSSWAAGCASAGTARAAAGERGPVSPAGRCQPQQPPPPRPRAPGSPGRRGGGSPSAWCR